jgi:hypothetical protein
MFSFEACEVLKIKEFTLVNDCFQNKHNEENERFGQTLKKGLNKALFCYLYAMEKREFKDLNIHEQRLARLFRLMRIAKMLRSAKIKITPQPKS